MNECWSVFKILTGKTTENRHLERSRHRWEENFRLDLREVRLQY
jgi:hypothetical protein